MKSSLPSELVLDTSPVKIILAVIKVIKSVKHKQGLVTAVLCLLTSSILLKIKTLAPQTLTLHLKLLVKVAYI